MAGDLKQKLVKWGKAIPRGPLPSNRAPVVRDENAPLQIGEPSAVSQKQITMAAMIYAIGAGVLFVFALYNLMNGAWFNGVVIFIPAGSLLVLSYKYLQ